MAKKNSAVKKAIGPIEKFFRIVELDLKSGDSFRGYQPEIITVQDGVVIDREMVSKPDLFEFAQAAAVDLIDPRNAV